MVAQHVRDDVVVHDGARVAAGLQSVLGEATTDGVLQVGVGDPSPGLVLLAGARRGCANCLANDLDAVVGHQVVDVPAGQRPVVDHRVDPAAGDLVQALDELQR